MDQSPAILPAIKSVQLRKLPVPPGPPTFDPDFQPTREFPYVLTLDLLEHSGNICIVELKEIGWSYTDITNGSQFAQDIIRNVTVNGKNLDPDKIQDRAKISPLILNFASLYSQKPTYLFNNAIWQNVDKCNFVILHKNYSTNIEIGCDLYLLMPNTTYDLLSYKNKYILIDKKLYYISANGKAQLVKINDVDKFLKEIQFINTNNAEKIFFTDENFYELVTLNGGCALEVAATFVRCITDNNVLMMIDLSVQSGEGQLISIPGRIQTIFEIVSDPTPGLKLKAIKISNSVLRDLVFENFEEMNGEILNAMACQAKQEESMESLYEWYMEQAKFFLGDKFSRDYNPPLDCNAFVKKFLLEVKIFLEGYSEPKLKYQKFIADVSLFFKSQLPDQDIILTNIENPLSAPEINYSKKHLFFLQLYALIKIGSRVGDMPLPLPTVGLDVDGKLYIILPRESIMFIAAFREYNLKLFNQVFNAKDEDGNCMALFKHSSELKNFLVDCKMNSVFAKKWALDLHAELCQDKSWKKLVGAKAGWQQYIDELAAVLNLSMPSKEVSDELFRGSPEGKKIFEENWRKGLEKNTSDARITGPLLSNGIHKPCLMEYFKNQYQFSLY